MLPLCYRILVEAINNPGYLIMKISTIQHENLDRSTWKSGPFIMKILTIHNKISTARNKISTARNKISIVRRENKSYLLAQMAFHTEPICLEYDGTWCLGQVTWFMSCPTTLDLGF